MINWRETSFLNWRLIRELRNKLAAQEEKTRHVESQLAIAVELARYGNSEVRAFKAALQKVKNDVTKGVRGLTEGQERTEVRIMATIQDVFDKLDEQNTTILTEVNEIKKAMDELKLDPAKLDEVIAKITGNTDKIKEMVNEPLPEPDPLPDPMAGKP
jgi:chromosome segregation ATPase